MKAYTPINKHNHSIIKIIGSGDKPINEHLRDNYDTKNLTQYTIKLIVFLQKLLQLITI